MAGRAALDGAYFRAAREVIEAVDNSGIVDWVSMFPIPQALEGLIIQADQLRLLTSIHAMSQDDEALQLFLHGDGDIHGYEGLLSFGSATVTALYGDREAQEPPLIPAVGSLAKPAFDLGMIYADSGREALTDASTIAKYAAVHAIRIVVEVPITAAAAKAAAIMYGQGYAWETNAQDLLPSVAQLTRKYLSNLDRDVAKLEGRKTGRLARLFGN